jgi:hypothetical protein
VRLLACILPLSFVLAAGTCGPDRAEAPDGPPGPDVVDGPCTVAMCGAVPSVPPRMCEDRSDGFWVIEEVTGCGRDEDTGVCGWQVFSCSAPDGPLPPLACTLPNSCPDGSACLDGFCYAREWCNDGQDVCPTGSLCCLATNACVPADRYDLCPLPERVLPTGR